MTDSPAPIDAQRLPAWLANVADDPAYKWAVSAWERASKVEGAWFDHAKADQIVAAWPKVFRLTEDRFAGKPFILLLWQELTVRLLVGWKKPIEIIDPEAGKMVTVHVRIFRRLDLWIPRKNGKSEFLAGLGVLFFVMEPIPGAQGFVFARDENQGRIPFSKMKLIIAGAKGLMEDSEGNQRIQLNNKSIYVRPTRALCELLTGIPDGKHGRSPTVIVGDEMHEWRTRELADTLRQGTGVRLQPIELYASTAGRKEARIGYDLYKDSLAILEGEMDDPSVLVVHFAIGEEDDWADEATWKKANPSLGLTPTLDYLRTEYRKAKGAPVKEALFQCYHLNRWVDQIGGWLPKSKWRACTTDPKSWRTMREALEGRTAFGAFDVSATRDLTAWEVVFPPVAETDPWMILSKFWVPEDTLGQRAEEDKRVNWREWIESGALHATPGDFVDQNFVQAAVLEDFAFFDMQLVGYDPWNAQKLVGDLQEAGLPAECMREIRMGHRTLGEPTKEFERLVFAGRLDHGGHPVLSWMAGHCRVRLDANMNYVPDKGRSIDKIDGIVGGVMALGLAMSRDENGGPSVYEDRGALVL